MLAKEIFNLGGRSTPRGLAIFAFDAALYLAITAAIVRVDSLWLKLALGVAGGFAIGFLFLLGHDACHQSLTPRKRLNHVLGRLAFLPSLHPFSLWDLGHNRVHHRFTNLREKDYVWAPLTLEEYERASRWQRLVYRFYRTPIGCLCYFLVDIWWRRMFAYELTVKSRTWTYQLDRALVAVFIVAQVAGIWTLDRWFHPGAATGAGHTVILFGSALVLPFLVWNALASFLIYLHHTHPTVRWYREKSDWARASVQLESTVHTVFPGPINWLLHRIMEHTAHHVNPAIPCYHLKKAQDYIVRHHPDQVVVERWSLRKFLDSVRRCKLYDFDRGVWTDYEGRVTSVSAAAPAETAASA